jgi:putative glycosyltransferase
MADNVHISIVTTLYRSERFLEAFLEACYTAVAAINCNSFEIIVVNDGSPDNSLQKVIALKNEKYPEVTIIDLSRNFGHHYALHAGIRFAKGDYVLMIDCDLEVDPAILGTFYQAIQKDGYDVVYGYQEKRKGKFVEKRLGSLFWKIFNAMSDVNVPASIITETLMSRRFVNAFLQLGDSNLFIAGMLQWTGYKQLGLPVLKTLREGQSSYTFKKRIALLVNAISTFSGYPLRILFNVGILITIFSFIMGSFLIIRKLVEPARILTGFTSLSVILLFSTGLIMSSLGIIGIYLEKIFIQSKGRPNYIVKDIY